MATLCLCSTVGRAGRQALLDGTVANPNGQSGGPDAGDELTNTYNGSGQVTEQVDPKGRTTTFSYTGDNLSPSGGTTTITSPNSNVTVEDYVWAPSFR